MQIYSKISEYAIRSLKYLALQENNRSLVRRICDEEKLPLHFTRKALQTLARHGIVQATRGPRGGYLLSRKPSEISLNQVVRIFDGNQVKSGCQLGSHRENCPVCALQKDAESLIQKRLTQLTLKTLIKQSHPAKYYKKQKVWKKHQ